MPTTLLQTINTTDWTQITLTGTSMIISPAREENKAIRWSFTEPAPLTKPSEGYPTLPEGNTVFDASIWIKCDQAPYKIAVSQ